MSMSFKTGHIPTCEHERREEKTTVTFFTLSEKIGKWTCPVMFLNDSNTRIIVFEKSHTLGVATSKLPCISSM